MYSAPPHQSRRYKMATTERADLAALRGAATELLTSGALALGVQRCLLRTLSTAALRSDCSAEEQALCLLALHEAAACGLPGVSAELAELLQAFAFALDELTTPSCTLRLAIAGLKILLTSLRTAVLALSSAWLPATARFALRLAATCVRPLFTAASRKRAAALHPSGSPSLESNAGVPTDAASDTLGATLELLEAVPPYEPPSELAESLWLALESCHAAEAEPLLLTKLPNRHPALAEVRLVHLWGVFAGLLGRWLGRGALREPQKERLHKLLNFAAGAFCSRTPTGTSALVGSRAAMFGAYRHLLRAWTPLLLQTVPPPDSSPTAVPSASEGSSVGGGGGGSGHMQQSTVQAMKLQGQLLKLLLTPLNTLRTIQPAAISLPAESEAALCRGLYR